MISPSSSFFDCEFLYSADDVAGSGPYVVFEDEEADPFLKTLTAACRDRAGKVYRSVEALAETSDPVFIAAPVWHRRHEALAAAGVKGARAKVLLYFDCDPSGYWDFAKGCQGSLARLFRTRILDDEALSDLTPFLEQWLAGRPFAGHMTSLVGQANREFRALLEQNGSAITRVFANFSDDVSRAVYARILFGTPEDIFSAFARQGFGDQQYMEIVDFQPGEHIVNCGVGRGWELPYFISKMSGRGKIYNFDTNTTYTSSPYAAMLADFGDMISDHPTLLGNYDGQIDLPVAQGNMVRSSDQAIEGQALKTTFPIRSIDSLAREGVITRADYIKMDVEGGEKYILEGAMETIRKFRPKLAVAIYHEPNHFWDYPNYLLDNLEDYNFYLRQYGYSRFETLLYAIPRERDARSGHEGFSQMAQSTRRLRDGLASFYLFDRKPRDFFIGPHRILSRFHGASWNRAELDCGPRIEADRVVGVWEEGTRRYYATRHKFDDGNTRVSFGRGADNPLSVDWLCTFGCAEDAVVLPVSGAGNGLTVAVAPPDLPVGIGFWDGKNDGAIVWRAALDFIGEPYAVAATKNGYEAYLPGVEPGSIQRAAFDAKGRRVEQETYVLPVPGDFLGVVRLKRFVDGAPIYERGFAVGERGSGVAEILVLQDGRMQSAGALDLDPDALIVQIAELDRRFKA